MTRQTAHPSMWCAIASNPDGYAAYSASWLSVGQSDVGSMVPHSTTRSGAVRRHALLTARAGISHSPQVDRASGLSSAFAAGLGGGGVMPEADPGAAIAALFEAGQAAFPAIAVEATALARYLGERCSAAGGALPPPSLAADVYLACACVLGVPGAHAAFEREFSGVIARAAAGVEPSPAFADDLRQVVLEGLFSAPPSATPKIAGYAGRAPLRTFLRVIAVRTAINLRRRKADMASTPLDEERGDRRLRRRGGRLPRGALQGRVRRGRARRDGAPLAEATRAASPPPARRPEHRRPGRALPGRARHGGALACGRARGAARARARSSSPSSASPSRSTRAWPG